MEDATKREHYALDLTKEQEVLHTGLTSMLKSAGVALNMSPVEIAAVLGAVAGTFAACKDDVIVHDSELMELLVRGAAEHSCAVSITPCRDVMMLNIDQSNKAHYELHRKMRETGINGEFIH